MDEALRKEQFSMAYIRVVAAQAGLQVVRPEVDDDSVDGVIMADFGRRPRLEVQAKATSLDTSEGDYIHLPLKIKNYNDLRMDTLHPRVLVVLIMPKDEADWLTQSSERLCLHHCAYWLTLHGLPPTSNTSTVTVEVPKANVFDSEQLTDIMHRIELGELP